MRRTILIPAFLVLLSAASSRAFPNSLPGGAAASAVDESLSLEQAVELALTANPMIRATQAARRAAGAGIEEAKAGRLPALQFKQSYTNSNNPVFVFGSLLEQSKFGPANFDPSFLNSPGAFSNFRTGLNLQLPVFDKFQTDAGIEQARIREGQAELQEEWVRQQLRLGVLQSYFGLMMASSRKAVAAEAVRSAEAEAENIRAKVEQGLAVSSDLLAMEVQLADFRQQLIQSVGEEKTAQAALNMVLARPVEQGVQLSGELLEKDFPETPQSDLLATALANRPDFLSAAREIDTVQQQVRVAKGQYWPDLSVFAQYGLSSEDLASGSADYAVGASLNFNVVDFGRSARIERAVAGLEGVRAERDRVANQVRFEVVQAYQGFKVARERLQLAGKAVEQAAEAHRIVQDRHQVGLTTITEVLRSQTALLQARLNLLGARYEHYLGFGRILLVSGMLKDVAPFSN